MANRKITTVTLKLHGHYAGKTVKLNGVQFRNGRVKLVGPADDIDGLMNYLGKSYRALPEIEVKKYGASEVEAITQSGGTEEISGDLLQNGEGLAKEETLDLGGDDDFDIDPDGPSAGGNGHGHAGISEGERFEGTAQGKLDPLKLKGVLESLDPKDDACWTTMGFAKLDKVCTLYGNEGVTRRDVEAVWPELTRKMRADSQTTV